MKNTEQERDSFEAWAEAEDYPIRRGFGKQDDYDFVETRRMWFAWQAARRAPVGAVPKGWRLVPVEPTEEMIDMGRSQSSFPAGVYRAMLAAAPQPPES